MRFATQPYQTKNRKQKFCHLTNFSINKKAQNYKKASGAEEGEEENCSKWSIKQLAAAFKSMDIEFDGVWAKIKDVIIKAVISVEPILANNLSRAANGRRICFEVFGFDIILDRDLKPWLLEVNVLPSLSSSSELDKKIKTSLMCDTFNTIGIVPYKKKQFEKETEIRNWEKFTGLTRKTEELQPKDTVEDVWSGQSPFKRDKTAVKLRSAKEILAEKDQIFNREEQLVVVEVVEEYTRKGNFDLIFPRSATVENYKKYFKVQRATNTMLWTWLQMSKEKRTSFFRDFKIKKQNAGFT